MAAISEYEKVPASDSRPAAAQTSSTVFAPPTLQVMTRVLRNTPVPIMLATLTAVAAQGPTPRVNSPRAGSAEAPMFIAEGSFVCSSIGEMQPDFSQIGPFLVAALVVFAIYRRFRRNFGRQPLRPTRMTVRIVLLTVLICLLLPAALRSAQYLAAELAGAALGIGLGVWGARRTRFLMRGGQLQYVPHTYTGIAVSLLFLGRLVYRLIQVSGNLHAVHAAGGDSANQAFAPASMLQRPLTLGLY